MKRLAFLTFCMLAPAASLQAQAAIVLPDKPLPAELARIQDAAYVLRDTLFAVTGAAARLNRDFQQTSGASLISRAREIKLACAAVTRNIDAPRTAITGAPAGDRLQERERKRLLGAFDDLAAAAAACAARFEVLASAGNGEEVRGYGNHDAQAMVSEIRKYESALDGYFRSMRIPNRPRGAQANPLAG